MREKQAGGNLFIRRFLLLAVEAVFSSCLFYLQAAVILISIYGGADSINLPAAADELFFMTAGTLTRFEFTGVQIIFSAITAFVLGLGLWSVLLLFNNVNIGIFAYILLCAADIILFFAVSSKSLFRWIHYVNIYYLFFPNSALKYGNWGYGFGIAGIAETVLILAIVLGIVFFGFNLYANATHYFSGKNNIIERMVFRVMDLLAAAMAGAPQIIKEMYKIIISQRVGIILIILLYVVINMDFGGRVMYNGEMVYVSDYYAEAEGLSYSEELENIYKHYKEDYDAFLADTENEIDEYTVKFRTNVLNEIRVNVDYLKEMKEKGINAVVLKPYEYNHLFGENQEENQKLLALIGVFAAITLSAGFISYEKSSGVYKLAMAGSKRRMWLLKKMMSIFLILGIFECVTYGIYYYNLFKICKPEGILFPLKSIPMFKNYIFNTSVAGFMVTDFLIRFMLLCALAVIMCFISQYIKLIYCMLTGLIITVPQLCYMLGFEIFDNLSVGKYIAFLPVFNGGYVIVYLLWLCNFARFTWNIFSKKAGVKNYIDMLHFGSGSQAETEIYYRLCL